MKGKFAFYLFVILVACAILSAVIAVGCQKEEPSDVETPTPPASMVYFTPFETRYISGKMEFFSGLDGISHIRRGTCVKPVSDLMVVGAPDREYKVKIIKTTSELQNELGVSSNARLGIGAWEASSEAKYLRSQESKTYSVYAVASSFVTSTEYYYDVELTEKAQNVLKRDYVQFRDTCGDYYLQKIITGGKYVGIIEIKTQSSKDQSTVMSALSGKGPMAGGEVDMSSRIKKVSESYSLDIKEFISGGSGNITNAVNFEQMLENARNFSKNVSIGGPAESSYKVYYMDYQSELEFSTSDNFYAHRAALDKLADYYDKYQALLPELQHIHAHINNYPDEIRDWKITLGDGKEYTLDKVQKWGKGVFAKKGVIQSMLAAIEDAAKDCRDNPGDCSSKLPDYMVSHYNDIVNAFPLEEVSYCENCAQIAEKYPTLGDDEYTLYYQGKEEQPYTVFCQGLKSWEPKEYLTLNYTNRSGMSAGGYYKGSDVTTTWKKIRINPDTLKVNMHDLTHADTSGSITFKNAKGVVEWTRNYAPYGFPSNGNSKGPNKNSYAVIDLRGTPFAVHRDVKWDIHGVRKTGQAVSDEYRQVWEIRAANGSTGWAKPGYDRQTQLVLEYIGFTP